MTNAFWQIKKEKKLRKPVKNYVIHKIISLIALYIH